MPLEPFMLNTERSFELEFATYRNPPVGSTASAFGAASVGKGEPATSAKLPGVRSIVKADPVLSLRFTVNKNFPNWSRSAGGYFRL